MKKVMLSFLLTGICYSGWSQITIKSTDMPSAGDIFLLSNASALGLKDTTGADVIWDYSKLNYLNQGYDTMLAKNDMPFAYQIFFLTSSYGERLSQDVSLGSTFSLKNAYNMYKNSGSFFPSNKFELTGTIGELNGIPTPAFYSPTDVWYNFPVNYRDSAKSNSAYAISVPTIGGFSQKRTRVNKVDGWGTLIIPLGTFDVLRIKSTVTDVDSFHIDALNYGLKLPAITRYEYKFLGKSKGLPLLQINANDVFGTPVFTSVIYQDTLHPVIHTDVKNPERENMLNVFSAYPNPAGEFISIVTDEGKQLKILDLSGRMLNSSALTSGKNLIDIHLLPNGIYLIRVSNVAGKTISRKLIVQH